MIMLMLTGLKRMIIAIYYNHLLALLALEPIFRRSREHFFDRYERETIPTIPSHCTSVLIGFHNMGYDKITSNPGRTPYSQPINQYQPGMTRVCSIPHVVRIIHIPDITQHYPTVSPPSAHLLPGHFGKIHRKTNLGTAGKSTIYSMTLPLKHNTSSIVWLVSLWVGSVGL